MQFKHPELLYALFLLLIPIFIHLFQLRRFTKIPFTNVAFLKRVTIQTRKSSRLKKWLTLLLRLLALASIILAFAQPFLASKTAVNAQQETVVYVDNSFSMQAKGQNGVLLKQALKQLYDSAVKTQRFSWFTNDQVKQNTTLQEFKDDILKTGYSHKQLPLQYVFLKANRLFSKNPASVKRLILLSDFQVKDGLPEITDSTMVSAVQLKPVNLQNISIDTLYIQSKTADKIVLTAQLSVQLKTDDIIPVSVYDDESLVAKSSVTFTENTSQTLEFEIPNNTSVNGKISINDPTLNYDNSLYFSISKPKKINVLSVNQAKGNFLQRIYLPEEFTFTQQTFSSLDYNALDAQHLIILNELESIPVSLQNALVTFIEKGGSLLVIPSTNSNLENYNRFLSLLNLPPFTQKVNQERKITQITFNHPVYEGVFEKNVTNFQYPKVQSYFKTIDKNVALLRFEDGSPFMINNKNSYVSTAAFNEENSNFKQSPLIVPTLYNIAKQSLATAQLYYTIGKENNISIDVALQKDQVLILKDNVSSFIPLQKSKLNTVEITTTDIPDKSGNYEVFKEKQSLQTLSYNYARTESNLIYHDLSQWKNVETFASVKDLFTKIAQQNNITLLWKWFVIAALVFLLLEMLVLKFFKG